MLGIFAKAMGHATRTEDASPELTYQEQYMAHKRKLEDRRRDLRLQMNMSKNMAWR